jgi:hypothetical protein
MTLEEYLKQPFKYDGECNPIPISEIWMDLTRQERREIQRQLKKGKTPNIVEYL